MYGPSDLGALPVVVSGAAGLVKGIASLFGGGPDKQKVKDRTAMVTRNAGLARARDLYAWHMLGAVGKPAVPSPVELPAGYYAPVSSKPYRKGGSAAEWGDVYNPIRQAARSVYLETAPLFAAQAPAATGPGTTQGAIGAVTGTGGSPALPLMLAAAAAAVLLLKRR